jgi:glutathione synthase/RimK-type ligase-like ATP-grasp enzyme
MKLGFIVGRENEICHNKELMKLTPDKYLVNKKLHIDVAIAMTVKLRYPYINVDIIQPKEISLERLKRNDLNFVVGYDYINTVNDDPYIKKFEGERGNKIILDIYKNKDAKLFPSYEYMNFIWNKKKYLTKFLRANIPISPTLFISKTVSIPKLLAQIDLNNWDNFIIKPIGGTTSYGVGLFNFDKVINEPTLLFDYFTENGELYDEFLVQPLIKGFKKYGEIKSFWINGEFSYAVNTIDRGEDDYQVKEIIDKNVLNKCKEIGNQVIKKVPKMTVLNKKTDHVVIRIDMTCCLDNSPKSSLKYYLNEIEEGGIAGTYLDFKNVKYPMVEILADSFVKKAQALINKS